MDQTTNFGMNNYQFVRNNMNQINNFNGFNNPMLNQYNQINPILNQMNYYNQCNQMLNQMGNCNQNNQMLNQMNQMMAQMMIQNMNQMNEINQEKRKKEMIQNINLNNLNKNQMELINSIIKFYKENGNEYMSFDYPIQIKNILYFISLNYPKLDKSNNIEDPLDYIKEPKKIIRFINSDYKEYRVNIPLSITKYDLYSIAKIYRCSNNVGNISNILLINNNLILNRDETTIECINNNDIIIIIEPRNFPDDSYYNSLKERTEKKGNISFLFSSGKKINRIFPDDIKIYEIFKSINLEFGLYINAYKLLYNGKSLEINDHRGGSFLFGFTLIVDNNRTLFYTFFGKIVVATIKYNKKILSSIKIGLLNSVKDLITEAEILNPSKKLKKLKIGNKAIERDDVMSLFSLGIKNNFTCFAEYDD